MQYFVSYLVRWMRVVTQIRAADQPPQQRKGRFGPYSFLQALADATCCGFMCLPPDLGISHAWKPAAPLQGAQATAHQRWPPVEPTLADPEHGRFSSLSAAPGLHATTAQAKNFDRRRLSCSRMTKTTYSVLPQHNSVPGEFWEQEADPQRPWCGS
jgi:hypothetical protein